jgi:hypothetical protein
MITLRRATSRPAKLTGAVGRGAPNRPHDVALVQALLLQFRSRGKAIFRGRITGRYDRDTAAAVEAMVAASRKTRTSALRRLEPSGAVFRALAQGHNLSALEGTAHVYTPRPAGSGGRFVDTQRVLGLDLQTAKLRPALALALRNAAREIHRALGIELDVTVFMEDDENNPVALARFTPRGVGLLDSRGRRLPELSSENLGRIVPGFVHPVGAALRARLEPVTKSARWFEAKRADDLADQLTFPVSSRIDGFVRKFRSFAEIGRRAGLVISPRLLDHYLDASGRPVRLTREEAFKIDPIKRIANVQIKRFNKESFEDPRENKNMKKVITDLISGPARGQASAQDEWKKDFEFIFRRSPSIEASPRREVDHFLAFGKSKVISTGDFVLKRRDDRLSVEGTIVHRWEDFYDFDNDVPVGIRQISGARTTNGKIAAKSFSTDVAWGQVADLELKILGPEPPLELLTGIPKY